MGVILADHVEDVPSLERDAELMTRDVEVVIGTIGEVGPVVELQIRRRYHQEIVCQHFEPDKLTNKIKICGRPFEVSGSIYK